MNLKKKIIIFILVILLPYLLVYRSFFTSLPLSWGDAPYYYLENLIELFNIPLLWDFRNANFGSPQAGILWLYIPTFLFGFFNNIFGFNHEVLIRLIFFIPSTTLSILGTFLLIGKFSSNFKGKILGSFFYAFNTYFLMVLDGGQIGVGLAYGIFPLACFTVINFLSRISIRNFILSVLSLVILTNVDLRVGIISVLFSVILGLTLHLEDKKYLLRLICLVILLFFVSLINSFWMIPFVLNNGDFPGGRFTEVGEVKNIITLLDSLSLYQPHFPLNDFGKVFVVPFYYVFLPLVLSLASLTSGDKKIFKLFLIYLLFAFFAKGLNFPFGEIYQFVINLPFGQAFRDSTKFYIPLILTSSILGALLLESVKTKYRLYAFLISYLYLLILIFPALVGNLTGSLGVRKIDKSFENIYRNIKKDQDFYRTIWFPEVPPLGFSTINHPAIYANRLYQDRPFASMIDGEYDLFNFLNNDHFSEWIALIGGRYLFYPENERKKILSGIEIEDRKIFLNFIDSLKKFEKLNWQISFLGYRNKSNSVPHIFAQKKAFLVVGGDGIYNKLFDFGKFNLAAQSFLFSEECSFKLKDIENVDKSNLEIIFYKKQRKDLIMNYLCNKFLDINTVDKSGWAMRNTNQYLKWKSELLEKGIRTYDYDLGKGIAYSTITGEKINKKLKIDKKGKYYFGLRYTTSSGSNGIRVKIYNIDKKFINPVPENFTWEILGPIELEQGDFEVEFTNMGGLVSVNTFGFINENDFLKAELDTDALLKRFNYYDLERDIGNLVDNLESEFIYLRSKNINPTEYDVLLDSGSYWIVFTDRFHKGWELQSSSERIKAIPGYSLVNVFYKPSFVDGEMKIYFGPQEIIPISLTVSIVLFGVFIILIGVKFKK